MSDDTSEIGPELLGDLADEESVRKLIECPICFEIPLPPIYLCAKGHIVCSSCQSQTYTCPLCRERYCNTRSFVAEGIVEKCKLHCRYADAGCKVILKGSQLGDHLPKCEYRNVKCRECADKLVGFSEYEHHLMKEHNLTGTTGTEAYIAYRINLNFMKLSLVDTCFWPQYFIKCFNQTFLFRLNVHQFALHPWVCLFGLPSDCEKYTALIEYEPSNDGEIVHSWKGPVNHFRDLAIDVIDEGRALTVPMQTVLECGEITVDKAEWVYRIVLFEKRPTTCTEPLVTESCSPLSLSPSGDGEEIQEILNLEDDKYSSVFEQTLQFPEDGYAQPISCEQRGADSGGGDQPFTLTRLTNDEETCPQSRSAHRQCNNCLSKISSKGRKNPQSNSNSTAILQSKPSTSSLNKNAVSVSSRPIERKPKCPPIQPQPVSFAVLERTMESAGNHGDIDDYSDFEF